MLLHVDRQNVAGAREEFLHLRVPIVVSEDARDVALRERGVEFQVVAELRIARGIEDPVFPGEDAQRLHVIDQVCP